MVRRKNPLDRLSEFTFPEAYTDPKFIRWLRRLTNEQSVIARQRIVDLEWQRVSSKPKFIGEGRLLRELRNGPTPAEELAMLENMTEEDFAEIDRKVKEQIDREEGRNVVDLGEFRTQKEKE